MKTIRIVGVVGLAMVTAIAATIFALVAFVRHADAAYSQKRGELVDFASEIDLTLRSSSFAPERIAESQRRGEDIIRALDSFHAAEGRYPTALDELVPGYLREIRDPVAGFPKWGYRTFLDESCIVPLSESFQLYFACEPYSYPVASYHSARGDWDVDR